MSPLRTLIWLLAGMLPGLLGLPSRASADVVLFEAQGSDLTNQVRFISPDDGNPDDRTVFQVKLPKPVEPGELLAALATLARIGEAMREPR